MKIKCTFAPIYELGDTLIECLVNWLKYNKIKKNQKKKKIYDLKQEFKQSNGVRCYFENDKNLTKQKTNEKHNQNFRFSNAIHVYSNARVLPKKQEKW